MSDSTGETFSGEHPAPACSGKCRGSCTKAAPRFFVIVACSGLICLLELHEDALSPAEKFTPESMQIFLRSGADVRQLLLVGSPTDLVWLHACMPDHANCSVVAEIPYPLMASWLTEAESPHLLQTLNQLLPTGLRTHISGGGLLGGAHS